ncbi:MAG: extracellular solute-binding protein [Longicatena sp.]
MKKLSKLFLCILFILSFSLQGCSKNNHGLDKNHPVKLTLWHYYTGPLKLAFDNLIDEFNNEEGLEKGIMIDAISKGSITNITKEIKLSLDKEPNAPTLPNIFAAYSDTTEDLFHANKLASLDTYLSKEEKSEYVDVFLEDGKLHGDEHIYIFPIAKASEVMVINKSAWEAFQKAEKVSLDDLKTWEGLTSISEKYYTYSGGKAFFGRDAIMNYFNVGSHQLGTDLFTIKNDVATLSSDNNVLRTLWDNYYVPYVKGYFTKNGKFASDDIKTMDTIASLSSSSSATFYPKEVIDQNNTVQKIDYIVLPVPNFKGTTPASISQGAGMSIVKSSEREEYASTVFLKWFTQTQRNTLFSAKSSYLPVKKEANTPESWNRIVEDNKLNVSPLLKDIVKVSSEQVQKGALYTPQTFHNEFATRSYLENAINKKAKEDQASVRLALENNVPREEALRPYLEDNNFENWINAIQENVNKIASGENK